MGLHRADERPPHQGSDLGGRVSVAGRLYAQQMPNSIADALGAVQAAQDQVSDLIGSGWDARDELLSVTVEAPSGSTGPTIASGLRPLLHIGRDVRMRVEAGVNYFELGLVQGSLELIDTRADDLSASFDGADLQTAQRARAGDTKAAINLPGTWMATASLNLAAPLTEADPTCAWRVVRRIEVLEHALSERPWWRVADLIEAPSMPVVYVVLDEPELDYVTGGFAVVGIARVEDFARPHGVEQKRTSVRAAAAPMLPDGIPLPEQLYATSSAPVSKLDGILKSRAAACAWAWLANSVTAEGDIGKIEFFGYRRVQFSAGADGITDGEATEDSLNLYRWATAETSPDRILAVRQVVSLNEGPELPSSALDVRRAAEPLFTALRSDAITEVLAFSTGSPRYCHRNGSEECGGCAVCIKVSSGEDDRVASCGRWSCFGERLKGDYYRSGP